MAGRYNADSGIGGHRGNQLCFISDHSQYIISAGSRSATHTKEDMP